MADGSLWARLRGFLEPDSASGLGALMGAGMVPGVGEALDIADIAAGIQDKDPARVGIGVLAAALPFVSSVGIRGLLKSPKKIRAYHGSPHNFDKFDLAKIGTGEGNQAYGKGVYLAESKDVAKYYRDMLSNDVKYMYGNIELPEQFGEHLKLGYSPQNAFILGRRYLEKDIEFLEQNLEWLKAKAKDPNTTNAFLDDVIAKMNMYQHQVNEMTTRLNELNGINKIDFDNITTVSNKGKLYTVDINADPETFLDLDAPLNKQSGYVRNVFRDDVNLEPNRSTQRLFSSGEDPKISGVSRGVPWLFKNSYADISSGSRIAESLKNEGISGIKFMDAASRTGDSARRTRNYVVFDPDIIDIVDKRKSGGIVR